MPTTVMMSTFDIPTRSASGFLLRYIAPRMEPVHLLGPLVNRLAFDLCAPQSDIIIGTGHGEKEAFTGQNESVILEVGKYNPRVVKGKVVKLLSCLTGAELGPDIVQNGAFTFMGYKDDFVWVTGDDVYFSPWNDKFARPCLLPVINGLNALLDGKTAGEAFETELQGYLDSENTVEDELTKSCLAFNYNSAVLYGDPEARIKARPRISFPFPPPPLIF